MCGVLDPPPDRVAADEVLLREAMARVPAAFNVTIPVKFHVLHAGAAGKVAASAVAAQMDALNVAYSGQARRADGTPGGGANTGACCHGRLCHRNGQTSASSA